MLRNEIRGALETALRAHDSASAATLRLMLAAIKDRDIAARSKGNLDGIVDAEVLSLLQSMIKQRRESIRLYEQGGRLELAEQEDAEITVIEGFLPTQLSNGEMETAVDAVIKDIGATNLKDMGRTMNELKSLHPGCMDFTKASIVVKSRLV